MNRFKAFFLGVREFRSDFTSNPGDDLMETYDAGRELAHKLTFRHFEHYLPEETEEHGQLRPLTWHEGLALAVLAAWLLAEVVFVSLGL